MNEHAETKPRNRWFQFDLRVLLVVIAAIAVVLALEFRPRYRANQTSNRELLDVVRVGEPATVDTTDGQVTIVVSDEHSSVISEIGADFIAIKFQDGRERFIPFSRITRVTRWPKGLTQLGVWQQQQQLRKKAQTSSQPPDDKAGSVPAEAVPPR